MRLIGTVFKSELRAALRDRNTVVYSLVIPLALYPILFWGIGEWFSFQQGSLEKQKSRVVIEEQSLSPLGEAIAADERWRVVETETDPLAAVGSGDVDAFVRIEAPSPDGGTWSLHAWFDEARDRSRVAKTRLGEVIEDTERALVEDRLLAYGETNETFAIINIETENIASAKEVGQTILARVLPMLLVFMLSMGAMHPAVDVLAGEKERKTIETILVSGAPREAILAGKYLLVVTAAFAALVLNLIGMVLAFKHMFSMMGDAKIQIAIPFTSVLSVLFAGLLFAGFVSAVMVLFASFARTFKEGQSYVTPFYLLMMFPTLLAVMPGVELDLRTAWIPITNVALLFREVIAGNFPWGPIAITLGTLVMTTALVIAVARRVYADEELRLGSGGKTLRSLPSIIRQSRKRSART
ncbi:MAG: ABC transporter permease [Gemmatimonadetes bacterium]|nr:ABC transporter permease [Gemmatimonadota bacterium]